MYFTYGLISKDSKHTYVGSTGDVERRISEHNNGKVKSSKPYRPYEVLLKEEFKSLIEARNKESFYKSTTGRRRLKQIIHQRKQSKEC